MPSPWTDLDRPPLREQALRRGLVDEPGIWTDVRVLDESSSTNVVVAAAARDGAAEGLVVVAESQTAGRGRLDRDWSAPPRSGLTFSALLRPAFPRASWPWLALLAGVAVAAPLRELSGLDVSLKWPNDVMVDDRKLGGILTEVVGTAVVVGIGLNVSLRDTERPVATATSLLLEGSEVMDRDPVLRAVLRALEQRYVVLGAAAGDAERSGLAGSYRELCATIARDVQVELPGGAVVTGTVRDVDDRGQLVVDTADGVRTVGAGDVVHVR
jgi:BirA family biotin operon repressor/biotin-[acetyl-CoA-carboxylase] ligase